MANEPYQDHAAQNCSRSPPMSSFTSVPDRLPPNSPRTIGRPEDLNDQMIIATINRHDSENVKHHAMPLPKPNYIGRPDSTSNDVLPFAFGKAPDLASSMNFNIRKAQHSTVRHEGNVAAPGFH